MAKRSVCPLCGSVLTKQKYLEIVGIWQERKRMEVALNARMQELQREKVQLRAKEKEMRHAIKRAATDAADKATKKE